MTDAKTFYGAAYDAAKDKAALDSAYKTINMGLKAEARVLAGEPGATAATIDRALTLAAKKELEGLGFAA